MGIDIHLHAVKYNEEDNLYHELKLYTKDSSRSCKDENGYSPVWIYDSRNYEMFDALQDRKYDEGYGYFSASPVRYNSLDPELKEKLEKKQEYCYGFRETTLADMKNYLNEHPKVLDFDVDWDDDTYNKPFEEKPLKTNPIKYLYENICTYIRFADWMFGCSTKLSDYKIIYYFDC